jgi:hypothetical protein
MRLAFAGPNMQSEKAGQLLQTSKHQKPSNKHQTNPKSETEMFKTPQTGSFRAFGLRTFGFVCALVLGTWSLPL